VILTIWQADQTKKAKNVLDSIGDWDPERMSYFYVIDKVNGGVLARHVSEIPFFAFHYMNGYECEETNTIVLDINTYNSTDILFGINIPNFRVNLGNSTEYNPYDTIGDLTRFRLPLPGSGVFNAMSNREEGIAKRDFRIEGRMDLPRINPLFDRKPYRYAYGVHIEKPGYFADSIIKVDIEQKSTKIWMPENMNIVPSEAVMVPRPGGTKEDDGVLLTVVLDDERKLSSLVVLDACSMVEVARAEMPIVMGIGFHGIWGQSDK
jgi:torulene dioxygenase